MTLMLTVIICTYNPKKEIFSKVVDSLNKQDLDVNHWGVLLVDNNSSDKSVIDDYYIKISNHNKKKIVENRQGLAFARLRGFKESLNSDYLVLVDDDNILSLNYLSETINIFKNHNGLGAFNGKILAEYEVLPPLFVRNNESLLAVKDLGDRNVLSDEVSSIANNVMFSMIGAGLCLRTKALNGYLIKVEDKPVRLELDRVGKSLMSSGDNDIGETIQELGWLTGYFPQIQVTHIIPKERLSLNYMAKLNRGIRKGVVINSFFHGRIPYPPIHSYTLPLRFIKSYFRYKAWQSPENYIMWQGACGIYEGQTIIKKMKNQIKL